MPPKHSEGVLGAQNHGFLPLAECTSLLGPYFRQERRGIKGLTKGQPHTEGAGLDSDTSRKAPSRVLAPSSYSWPSWPTDLTRSLVSTRVKDSELRSSHLQSLHLAGAAASHQGQASGTQSRLDPALLGLHGGIAWTTPGCRDFSIGLAAVESETKKEPLPPVLEPRQSEPACCWPVVCPVPSWDCRCCNRP